MIAQAAILLLALPIFAFWIWMLVECLTKEDDTGDVRSGVRSWAGRALYA